MYNQIILYGTNAYNSVETKQVWICIVFAHIDELYYSYNIINIITSDYKKVVVWPKLLDVVIRLSYGETLTDYIDLNTWSSTQI